MKQPDYFCHRCGSTRVARLKWVFYETDEQVPNSPETGTNLEWCFGCENQTSVIDRDLFLDKVYNDLTLNEQYVACNRERRITLTADDVSSKTIDEFKRDVEEFDLFIGEDPDFPIPDCYPYECEMKDVDLKDCVHCGIYEPPIKEEKENERH